MKLVNLSRRPFLNTRPVRRAATILWIVGLFLLLTNVWLFGSHITGTSKGQGRLDALGRQIDQEQEALDTKILELRSLDLSSRNARVEELNELIKARTFPWSALFGALEETLPIDVYLSSVKPTLVKEKEKRAERRRPNRATTAREARSRARARAQGGDDTEETAEVEAKAPATDAEPGLIRLDLSAFARNDEAMFDLIDNLFASPHFETPVLRREALDEKSRAIAFNVSVFYRLPQRALPKEEAPAEEAPTAEQDGGSVRDPEGEDGGRSSGTENLDTPAEIGPIEGYERPRGRDEKVRNESRGEVPQGEPERRDEYFPPEEGEAAASPSKPERDRDADARPTFIPGRPLPAPSVDRQGGEPDTSARPTSRGRTRPTSRRPGATQPGQRSTDRRALPTRQDPRPVPPAPPASSSPRIQGSLLDRFLPVHFPDLDSELTTAGAGAVAHKEAEG